MKIVCVIPARLNSTRFPRKVLALLGKKTLLGTVIEAAKNVSCFDEILVAGCSFEVVEEAKKHGVNAVITDPNLENGTMRIIEGIERAGIEGDLFVNWQADEPFITEDMINQLIDNNSIADIRTLKKEIDKEDGLESSIVKVVTDQSGKAMYFSRSLIPYQRSANPRYFKHIGLYAFTRQALKKIKVCKKTPLEEAEVLEQLRWMEHGLNIEVYETKFDVIGIDTRKDLEKAIDL